MEKIGILIQIEKVTKASNGDLTCYLFSLEDEVAHLAVTDPSGILTIEKQLKKDFIAYKRAIKVFVEFIG